MKSFLLYLIGLAACVTISAQLGMADREAPGPSLSSVGERQSSSGDANYRLAVRRRSVIQTTLSLLPLNSHIKGPMASSSLAGGDAIEPLVGEIVVLPLGNLTREHLASVQHTTDALGAFYALPVRTAEAVSLDRVPEACLINRNGTWLLQPDALLDEVAERMPDSEIAAVVAMTEFRLDGKSEGYIARSISPGRAAAVISVPLDTDGDAIRLTMKKAIHSLSVGFGAPMCLADACLNSVDGMSLHMESRPLWLCPDCLARQSIATGVHPEQHVSSMASLCTRKGFSTEARHYHKLQQLLK